MPSILTLAAILQIAGDPACNPEAYDVTAKKLATIVAGESGGDPLVINVNADRTRGLPSFQVRSDTVEEAAGKARALLAAGRSIDAGLAQINASNWQRHGLTEVTVFNACDNLRAAAKHFAEDRDAVDALAHARYNCGRIDCGQAYAAGMTARYQRIRAGVTGQPAAAVPAPSPIPPRPPGDNLFERAGEPSGADARGDTPRLFSRHGG